jgi:predicted DNA-binding protein (UPF0251 family)
MRTRRFPARYVAIAERERKQRHVRMQSQSEPSIDVEVAHRAALILRDVLGFHVSEAARILDTTQQSMASALKRARATLAHQLPSARERAAPSSTSCVRTAA